MGSGGLCSRNRSHQRFWNGRVASEREFPYGARALEKERQVLTKYIL